MKISSFYMDILYILTPVLTACIALGWVLRKFAPSRGPNNTVWKNVVQAWLYIVAYWIITLSNIYLFFFIGFITCLTACIIGYINRHSKAFKLYSILGHENIIFFFLACFISTFLSSYLEYKGTALLDVSTELSILLALYSVVILCVCIGLSSILPIIEKWRDSLYRGWYYTFFAWILAYYGVESVLLSACILSWVGLLLSYRYTKEKQPIGCRLAKENITFITFFWIIRSFIYQPFIVPTGSLEPTIYPGDFVLVNQYAYGLRFPIWGWKLYNVGTPQRGDLVVFRFPPQPNILYVKRVIGLPGDCIQYQKDTLTINGTIVTKKFISPDTTAEEKYSVKRYREELPQMPHDIFVSDDDIHRYKNWDWTIPAGHYLMLGDNRQASNDSRFWGLVPDALIIGKVDYVILSVNKNDLKNIHIRNDRFIKNVYTPD